MWSVDAVHFDGASNEEDEPTHSVRIWKVDFHQQRVALDALDLVLRPDERTRRDRLRTTSQRDAFTIAHGASTLILAAETGTDPGAIRIERARCTLCGGPHGKPRLADSSRRVFFNISHSAQTALVAVSTDEIGVDVEDRIRVAAFEPDTTWLSLIEEERLTAVAAAERDNELLKAWVRKEAYLKGLGTGLNVHPGTIELVCDQPGAWRDAGSPNSRWRVFDVDAGWAGVAAVAIRHPRVLVDVLHWTA